MRLLIAYDGSEGADAAIDDLQRAGLGSEVEATILSVTEVWLPHPASSPDEAVRLVCAEDAFMARALTDQPLFAACWIEEESRGWIQEVIARAERELQAAGLKVSTVVKEGDPKKVLITEADKLDADCIFVGSSGTGNSAGRFRLGSVAAAVVARAHCSVEVVRAG